jgi:hypothetical protein
MAKKETMLEDSEDKKATYGVDEQEEQTETPAEETTKHSTEVAIPEEFQIQVAELIKDAGDNPQALSFMSSAASKAQFAAEDKQRKSSPEVTTDDFEAAKSAD